MLPPEQKSPVSLEDLLRLKRSERPDADFWVNFERELREKQLTALVQKRRWWYNLPIVLSRRVYVPAGAAAIVAFTLVTVRYSTAPLAVMRIENTASKIVAADPAIETLPATEVHRVEHMQGRYQESLAPEVESASVVALNEVGSTPAIVGAMPFRSADQESETPSARSFAANLANLEKDEPELANSVMGSRLSSPVRAQTVAAVQSESDSASSPRYRLIARYADHSLTPEPVAPALTRERIARRLGDDITDRISRIGVEGSRVSLKF